MATFSQFQVRYEGFNRYLLNIWVLHNHLSKLKKRKEEQARGFVSSVTTTAGRREVCKHQTGPVSKLRTAGSTDFGVTRVSRMKAMD